MRRATSTRVSRTRDRKLTAAAVPPTAITPRTTSWLVARARTCLAGSMDVHHVPLWFVLMALGAQLFISGAAAKFRALHDLDGFAAHDDAASTTRGNAASATWEASDGVKPVQYKHDSPPSPPRPRSSQQPDEVQKDLPFVSEELKCGERIPPESILTSTVGGSENSITTFAKSLYKGPSEGGRHHRWNYAVEFTNKGPSPVQLLTRCHAHLILPCRLPLAACTNRAIRVDAAWSLKMPSMLLH